MKCIFIFSVFYVNYVLSERSPKIVRITKNQIKEIGGTVELSCSVLYAQDYTVLWEKLEQEKSSDPIIISSDTNPIIRDSRFSLRYDTASTTYTLQIKDIQESDAGIFKCRILISQNNYISKEVILQVHSPPLIYDNSSSTVIVSENSPVSLECYAGGSPKPLISWNRENNALLPTGGSTYRGNILKINNVRKEDRGTYFCTAHNNVGKDVKRSIAVDVEFPPIVRTSKDSVFQALHFDADLECRVEAFPAPIIIWQKDGIQLVNKADYKISEMSAVDQYKDSTLRVISIKKSQYGTYICIATNKLGDDRAKVELYESDTAVCPPACGSGHYSSSIQLLSSNRFIFVMFILISVIYS